MLQGGGKKNLKTSRLGLKTVQNFLEKKEKRVLEMGYFWQGFLNKRRTINC
jgi:hypothetical protein